MKPEIEVKIGGDTHKLSLPFGGLEQIAEVNPVLVEVWQALQIGVYSLDELRVVLAAGLKWGGSDLSAEDAIEQLGVKPAAKVAADLMAATMRDDEAPKKKPATRKKRVS